LSVAACAATSVGGGAAVSASEGGAVTASTIRPSGSPAPFYRSRTPARPSTDPFAMQLKAQLDRHMKRLARPPLVEDARLGQVAYDLARITAENKVPAASLVTFLIGYYGLVEPEPNLIEIKGGDGAEAAAVEDLGRQIREITTAATWRQVGIGLWRSGTSWSATVALQEDSLTVDPLPRALPSGGHAAISGRVDGAYHSPEILVTPPRGAVLRVPAQVHGSAFTARLDCSLGDGVYQVEIGAEDRRGPTVLANFPVYCGVAAPLSLTVAAITAATASDAAAVARQVLDLMDRDRASNGLPLLQHDPRLAKVAENYSREMADTGEIAHLSQRTGSAVDRIRGAKIAPMPTVIAENVGRDYTAEGIERAFMASPGHRENILSRAVSHVGVGVALGKREGNAVPIFVTQVFAGWGQ
jgi:uncharacterized protein YkwD